MGRMLAALAVLPLMMAQPQTSAMLNARQAIDLMKRGVELVESTAVAVPGLSRAAVPLLDHGRETVAALESGSTLQSGLIYDFLVSMKGYLALSDTVPKPFPFPNVARQQFAELRDAAERLDLHLRALLDSKEKQLRSPDRDNLRRYAEANNTLAPATGGRAVFMGDSITDGWRLNEYFSSRDFVNRGISGQITSEMLARMKADVIDLKPKAVIILAGTNDIAREVNLTTIENNLTMMVELAQHHNIKPILCSVLPVSDYSKRVNPSYERSKTRPPYLIRELNLWIKTFCLKHNLGYVDYFTAMADTAGMLPEAMADDGLHPNTQGYRAMAPLALKAIEDAVRVRAVAPAAPVEVESKKKRK